MKAIEDIIDGKAPSSSQSVDDFFKVMALDADWTVASSFK
jgi:hypothetical protein